MTVFITPSYRPIQEMARASEKCWLNTPTTTKTSPEENSLNEVFHFSEICAQQLYNGMYEDFYHKDNSFNNFMSSSMNNSYKCLLTNIDGSEKVSLVSVNEDASFLVKVANEVTLTRGKLTKVSLLCAENTCKDLLQMNDTYKCTYHEVLLTC